MSMSWTNLIMSYLLHLDIVELWSVEDEVLVYYELIVLDFNDELRKKESGDVGPMKERVADEERDTGKVGTELIKDSGVNDLMMKNSDDELNVSMTSCWELCFKLK